MGKTYRKQKSSPDDEKQSGRSGSHPRHSNNKKLGGMRIISTVYDDEDEDYFDDFVETTDEIVINKNGSKTP